MAQDAARQLQAILAAEPGNLGARCKLGWLDLRTGACAESATVFRDVVARTPDEVEGLAGLGSALLCTGDLAGAAEALERARQIAPDDARVEKGLTALREAGGAQR